MVTDKGAVRQLAHVFDSKHFIDLSVCRTLEMFFGIVA